MTCTVSPTEFKASDINIQIKSFYCIFTITVKNVSAQALREIAKHKREGYFQEAINPLAIFPEEKLKSACNIATGSLKLFLAFIEQWATFLPQDILSLPLKIHNLLIWNILTSNSKIQIFCRSLCPSTHVFHPSYRRCCPDQPHKL